MTPFPPLPLHNNILRVDNSMLEDWQTCPRLTLYKHCYKLVRAGTVAARDMGKAWHSAMETWYGHWEAGRADRMAMTQDALRVGYDGLEMPENDHRSLGRMLSVLEKYADQWSPEQFVPLAVECPMEFELGKVIVPCFTGQGTETEITVIYQGRMDLLVQWTDDSVGGAGQILVGDTKTMQQWEDSKKSTEYRRSAQLKGYMWLVQQLARKGLWKRGAPIFECPALKGIGADVLRDEPWRSSILRDDIQPLTVHGYFYNAVVVRAETTKSKTLTPREEFKRLRFWPSQEDLEEWRTNTLAICADMLNADAQGRWPEHLSSCASQWGRPCSHIEVCDAPAEQRELGLSLDLFQDNVWDPMVKMEKE